MDERKDTSLADLDARIRKARGQEDASSGRAARPLDGMSGMGGALRIGIEMVSALVVGVGIGWLLDRWLETKPWFLVLFFFLGAAAGVLNVFRAVSGFGYAPAYKKDAAIEEPDADQGKDGASGTKQDRT